MSGESRKRHCFHNFVKIRATFNFTLYIYIYMYIFRVPYLCYPSSSVFFYYFSSDVLYRRPGFLVYSFCYQIYYSICLFGFVDIVRLFAG